MTWGAVAIGGASLLGGMMAGDATSDAAGQSADASRYAADMQERARLAEIERQKPFYDLGVSRLAPLSQGTDRGGEFMRPFTMQDYQQDPGYQFRQQQGMRTLEQGAAARGGLLSGNTLRAALGFGQDLASQEYGLARDRFEQDRGMRFNRLASLAGFGQTATGALGASGANYASNLGNIAMGNAANQGNAALMAGQSRASSLMGVGQALGGVDWSRFGGSSAPSGVNTSLQGFYTPNADYGGGYQLPSYGTLGGGYYGG